VSQAGDVNIVRVVSGNVKIAVEKDVSIVAPSLNNVVLMLSPVVEDIVMTGTTPPPLRRWVDYK
jgi:hypothetical protein